MDEPVVARFDSKDLEHLLDDAMDDTRIFDGLCITVLEPEILEGLEDESLDRFFVIKSSGQVPADIKDQRTVWLLCCDGEKRLYNALSHTQASVLFVRQHQEKSVLIKKKKKKRKNRQQCDQRSSQSTEK